MKTILAFCLAVLVCCSVADAGNFRNNNQRQRDFNAGVRAAQGNHCNNGFNQSRNFNRFNSSGRFNNPGFNGGGGNRNIQLGLFNFGR